MTHDPLGAQVTRWIAAYDGSDGRMDALVMAMDNAHDHGRSDLVAMIRTAIYS